MRKLLAILALWLLLPLAAANTLNVTVQSPQWYFGETKLAIVHLVANNSIQQTQSDFVSAGENASFEFTHDFEQLDILVNFYSFAGANGNRAKWRDSYSVNGVRYNVSNSTDAELFVSDAAIPVVQQNAHSFLNSTGMEEYAVYSEFLVGNRPALPLFVTDGGRFVENSRNWTVAVESRASVSSNYSYRLFAAGKPIGVRYYDAGQFAVLPFSFAHPFTALSDNVQSTSSAQVSLGEALATGGEFALELVPAQTPKLTGFAQKPPSKTVTLNYRANRDYVLSLNWQSGDVVMSGQTLYRNSLPGQLPLLFKPFSLALTLTATNNTVGNNFVQGFWLDRDSQSTNAVPQVNSSNSFAVIRDTHNAVAFDSRTSTQLPQQDLRAAWGFACDAGGCENGNYSLEWSAFNVINGQNLSLSAALEWNDGSQEFTVRHSRLYSQPSAPKTIALFASPPALKAGEDAAITATALDELGNPASDGSVLSFASTLGSITASNATSNGVATAILRSSAAGTANVSVGFNGRQYNFTLVSFAPNAPFAVALSANPAATGKNGNSTITATVTDAFGNAVENGTQISFSTSLGTVTASNSTFNGATTALLEASGATGVATVTGAYNSTVAATIGVTFFANCSVRAIPATGTGPFASIIFVNFTSAPTQATRATISCGEGLRSKNALVIGNYSLAICRYPPVSSDRVFTAVVRAGDSACSAQVRDLA